jgi:hypothetical protein
MKQQEALDRRSRRTRSASPPGGSARLLLAPCATLALACSHPLAPTVLINLPDPPPEPAAPAPSPPRPLPGCAPTWLGLVPTAPEAWSRVDDQDTRGGSWEGVWIEGGVSHWTFVVAMRRDKDGLLVYASKHLGTGLVLFPASWAREDRLGLGGHWGGSTEQASVTLRLDGPNRSSGNLMSFGPLTDPDDLESRGEPTERSLTFTRRCR